MSVLSHRHYRTCCLSVWTGAISPLEKAWQTTLLNISIPASPPTPSMTASKDQNIASNPRAVAWLAPEGVSHMLHAGLQSQKQANNLQWQKKNQLPYDMTWKLTWSNCVCVPIHRRLKHFINLSFGDSVQGCIYCDLNLEIHIAKTAS